MRMWMVPPSAMCRKHLLGEHVETHMLFGTLRRGKSIAGFLAKGLLEPVSLKERHDALAREMEARGFVHRSPIEVALFRAVLLRLDYAARSARVDVAKSLDDLFGRCEECKNKDIRMK